MGGKSKNKAPEFVPVSSGKTPEQIMLERFARQAPGAEAQPSPASRPPVQSPVPMRRPGYGVMDQAGIANPGLQPRRVPMYYDKPIIPGQLERQLQAAQLAKKAEHERKMKRRLIIGGVALVAVLGAGYGLNVGNVQGVLSAHADVGSGMNVKKPGTYGTDVLAADQCTQPEAVLMVATVSGDLPLEPVFATSADPKPATLPPYLTDKNLPNSLESLKTTDGYPHAKLDNLPLAMTVCGDSATEEGANGVLKIYRSKIKVRFMDPDQLFNQDPTVPYKNIIHSVSQGNGTSTDGVEADKGQYLILPQNDLLIKPGSDTVFNKNLTDLTAAMKTPEQQQVILAMMESAAVKQLTDTINLSKYKISFPDGAKSLRDAIDQALMKRFGHNSSNTDWHDSVYDVGVKVAKNKTTKQDVTLPDPKTNASPLKDIDPTTPFTGEITLTEGSLSAPNLPSSPTPTPTPTTTPVTGP
jgi:hypothetical protein